MPLLKLTKIGNPVLRKITEKILPEKIRDKKFQEFQRKAHDNLALDHNDRLVYIAPSKVNLNLTIERWPDIRFMETREY